MIALGFSTGVNIGSFRRDFSDALFSTFSVAGRKVVSSIEYAVKYGKSIDNFHGMERTLGQLKSYLPQVNGVAVALPDGQVVHSIGTYAFLDQIGSTLTGFERRKTATEFSHAPSFHYHDTDRGSHKLFLPIRGAEDGAWIGTLVIAASDAIIDDYVRSFERQSLIFVAVLGGVALVLLAGLALVRRNAEGGGGRAVLVIAALVQVAVGIKGYAFFNEAYLRTAENTTEIVQNIIATDFASVVGRGVTYRSFSDIDGYFKEITAFVPHIKRIELDLPDEAGNAVRIGYGGAAADGDVVVGKPLANDREYMAPSLKIVIDNSFIEKNVLSIVVNNVTILIISLMFLYELHVFASRRTRSGTDVAAVTTRTTAGMRFLTFSLYFGVFLSASFVPVIMQGFDQGFFGLTVPQAAAAPVSAEMMCGAFAIMAAGWLGRRAGWRMMTAGGLLLAVAGAVGSGLADHPVLFVVARGATGAGAMLALMGIYRLIDWLRRQDPDTGAYSEMFSGMYVGVNCGAVAGSLLAGEIGTRMVFLIAGAVLALALAQVFLLLPRAAEAAGKAEDPVVAMVENAGRPATRRPVWLDGSFVAFLLLVSIPTSACSMFLIYYFPLFASGLGQPTSTVGQAFLLYGLCIVYLGPHLSRALRNSRIAPAWPVLVSGLVMAAGLVAFALTGSLAGAFVAILLLGLSDSFGLSAQQRYLEHLPVVGTHGLAVPQSYHLNARKLGQVIGPLLFSAAAVAGTAGATLISAGLAIGLLLHLLMSLWLNRRGAASEAAAPGGAA
ncbi:hypothetical protein TSO352_31190 [Azospirillum sp. TSO35-2]|nr:hypothetical protein TSO352_31190 [Azospirillum sp. TSO35-2]